MQAKPFNLPRLFKAFESPLIYNYFCEKWFLGIKKDGNCEKWPNSSLTSGKYFITTSLKDQMETNFENYVPFILDLFYHS